MTMRIIRPILLSILTLALFGGPAQSAGDYWGMVTPLGPLKPIDSATTLKIGDKAPDFRLPTTSGKTVSLSEFQGKKNVVLSFVPAAFTPVCSGQWPGYNIARDLFESHNTVIIGISADNTPSQAAWTREMGGLWFPVASDFNPHGQTAAAYGVLRSDGTAERALFLIDTRGVIRYLDVHDINERPNLETLFHEMLKLRNP